MDTTFGVTADLADEINLRRTLGNLLFMQP